MTSGEATSRCRSLILHHVPKAAGSSLNRVIDRQYPASQVLTIGGPDRFMSVSEFKDLPEPQRQRLVCLRGHIPFGLHPFMPQPCAYITLLRDPVERAISLFYFALTSRTHKQHHRVVTQELSISDCVRLLHSSGQSNQQTRAISGVTWVLAERSASEMLDVAKQNLSQRFIVAELVERFDESLMLVKRSLGWKRIYYRQQNVTPDRPPRSEIPEDDLSLIRELNRLDTELYTYAQELFRERVESESWALEPEVRRFRVVNRVLNTVWTAADRAELRSAVGSRYPPVATKRR